jgi:Putative porin
MTKLQLSAALLAAAAGMTFATIGHAQSVEGLLNKLVDKGILTQAEADGLRSESTNTATSSFSSKITGAAWIKDLKFGGDFRGRFEENNADNPAYFTRDRFRYRLRVGVTAKLLDGFDIGLRLASGDPMTGGAINGNPGGLPITANQTMGSLESRKFIWIDAAYAKWTPVHDETWTVTGIIGKMDNPFQLSNMVWDYDINPEGGAFQLACNITDKHTLKGNGAFFVLDEINQGVNAVPTLQPSHDPYLYGFQALLESKWSPKFDTSLGVAFFDIAHGDSLNARAQPFYNSGNTRDANGFLVYDFNPIIGTASATYKLAKFPLYRGEFPLKLIGEYMENPGASANNKAYRVGGVLGKAGKKGTWEISYRYQRLEADAWFDALVDDDNGAFYAVGNPQMTGTGKTSGWYGGTNVRGHLVQATYSFTDFFNLMFTYYLNDLIINVPGQSSGASHFMVDLNWKF